MSDHGEMCEGPAAPGNPAFELCFGTVTGRHHVCCGRASQDSFGVMSGKHSLAAVVCDGCSSERHSEVGATVIAQRLANDMAFLSDSYPDKPASEMVSLGTETLFTEMFELAKAIDGVSSRWNQVVFDHMLFSVVGFVIGPRISFVFHAGDGWWWMGTHSEVNAGLNPVQIHPPHGNQPEYPGYLLLHPESKTRFGLSLDRWIPTESLQVVGVGTDGLTDLVERQGENVPGHQEKVGSISQFWQEDRFYSNPDSVRRKLWLCAQEHRRTDWVERMIVKEGSKLFDDTTLVCARRKAKA